MSKKVLIVGGVAGGASCAARLRRLDENSEIVIFERGPYISFANCGLPYYIGDTIKDRDALLLQTPESMKARFNIDVRVKNEVLSIDRKNKQVRVKNIEKNEEYTESYDVLVLSPGSTPIKPRIQGIDAPNIFSLWNVPDTDKIKNYINSNNVKNATVIGGGFIGIEMVENLKELGINVNLVEMASQVMAPLDYEMAQIVHEHLSQQDVNLYLDNGVQKFSYKDGKTNVSLQNGTVLESDLVILSIGITPNSKLAKEASLELNKRGGVVVDKFMKTTDSSIYAIGDVAEITNFITNEKAMIPLAGPANKQGRIVANAIAGKTSEDDITFDGGIGTSVAKVFDLTVASTGLNEKALTQAGKEYGKDYLVTTILPKEHASYYPGAFGMTLKVIFDKKGLVLGAQNIGVEGVEKRIDVIATSIKFHATIYDLMKLELSYAPPYSSAKDPVNMAGFSAENILVGDVSPILCREIPDLDLNKNIIIDVREDIEVSLGMIPNAIHIDVDKLRNELPNLSKEKTYIVYCAVGIRGYIASKILKQHGYKVKNLIGGYDLYKKYIKNYNIPRCEVNPSIKNQKDEKIGSSVVIESEAILLDACGLQCPGPIMKLNNKLADASEGQVFKVTATDPGFPIDAESWANKTGNTFVRKDKEGKIYVAYIKKGNSNDLKPNLIPKISSPEGSTMVVFSGDFDKAIASMIIANGAVAMGKKVTIFFTFWGLNILRKPKKVKVKKTFIEKMFSKMMPRGAKKLKLSNMNMGGIGLKMIKGIMKKKNVMTLDKLMQEALDSGVRMVACTMSMGLMGIKEEELIDGVELGGVAAYLGATENANHNLFI